MPFTPFHFGVGIALKAGFPRHFYFLFFVALQVLTDLETLYNLVYDRYPLHRFLHTFLGAGLLAMLASAAVIGFLRFRHRAERASIAGPTCASVVVTAFLATSTHVLLDSVMHGDMQPFAPFRSTNPFLGLLSVRTLHGLCLALGLAGGLVLVIRLLSASLQAGDRGDTARGTDR